jgi:beta-galactosidase
MVEYWHWSTTNNAIETYWRGLLSQDGEPNPTYEEARTIGADLARLGPKLVNMQKHNRIAIYVSNRALTAFDSFKFGWTSKNTYNDVLRPFYDALYRMNAEADFIDPTTTDLSPYKLIIVPALYAATDAEVHRLNEFARAGGHVFYTFKSGFSDENVKVRSTKQPGIVSESAGVTYNQFTLPENVSLEGDPYDVGAEANQARWWMELLTPTTATVVARYRHPAWGRYAAITRNQYGRGEVTYLGFMPSDALAEKLMAEAVSRAGLSTPAQQAHFPLIVRSGTLRDGHLVHYLLNYSPKSATMPYGFPSGHNLLTETPIPGNTSLPLGPWGFAIVEEDVSADRAALNATKSP